MPNLTVALDHFTAQDAKSAIAACDAILAADPQATGAMSIRALSLAMSGDFEQARRQFLKLISLEPSEPSHYLNLASALKDLGLTSAGLAVLKDALGGPADSPGLRVELALWIMDEANYLAAAKLLEPIYQAAPRDALVRALLARCLNETGRMPEAQRVLGTAKAFLASDPLSLTQAGIAYMQQDQFDAAEQLFRQALTLDASADDASYNLLALYERANQMEHVAALIKQLPTPRSAEQSLLKAKALRRLGDADAAYALLQAIDASKLNSRVAADLDFTRASLSDQRGAFDAAMAALKAAHAAQLKTYQINHPSRAESSELAWVGETVTVAQINQFALPSTMDSVPSFLVGFMRSGTTLMEQMLAAHPEVVTLDEKPALESVVNEVRRLGLRYPQDLEQFNKFEIDALRGIYFAEADRHVVRAPGTHLLDKYPFNMARIGLIRLLFPDAKIIFALRHPCDVVLSAVMQHFKINAGTVAFQSLESAARVYESVMSMWVEQRAVCAMQVHDLRYELLVESAEPCARALLKHLHLPWNPAVLAPNKQAKNKFISTPSYSQVATPIHQRSVERWRNYRQHFSQALPILAPWIARFGYAST